MEKLRCQRIGCTAMFTEDDNPDGSCVYHDSPIFHDGMRKWSCCKKGSHDFNLFLEIPGCKTGRHTTDKPTPMKASVTPKEPIPVSSPATSASSKESCSRCRQGFFCSDHGSQSRDTIKKSSDPVTITVSEVDMNTEEAKPSPAKKIIDINQPQNCKNSGCGKTFKERNNHETACDYHPGPAVFHDRMRGWKCCDIHVREFDEFMGIPPCSKGWHNGLSA